MQLDDVPLCQQRLDPTRGPATRRGAPSDVTAHHHLGCVTRSSIVCINTSLLNLSIFLSPSSPEGVPSLLSPSHFLFAMMLTSAAAAALDAELLRSGAWALAPLMELAGAAVARALVCALPPSSHRRLLCVAGPGNNGGDALVAARHAVSCGYDPVAVYAPRVGASLTPLVEQCHAWGVTVLTSCPTRDEVIRDYDVAIDGIFGFSSAGAPRTPFDAALALLCDVSELQAGGTRAGSCVPRAGGIPVLSIDVPSGWHVDAGTAGSLQQPHERLRPSVLVSLTAPKPCASAFEGKRHFVGGRGFVPPAIARAQGLCEILPEFPHGEDILELPVPLPPHRF